MKSWAPPTNEMIEKVLATVKKDTDRQYFFSRLKNPLWVEPLRVRGYFDHPPGMKVLPTGYVQYPNWPELSYLVTIAGQAPDEVVEIILALKKTDNPQIYDEILRVALALKKRQSGRLLPKVIEYIELDSTFLANRYPELLEHWTAEGNIDEAFAIAKMLIPFRRDPKARHKRRLREEDPGSPLSTLDPAPRFQEWEYEEILNKGIRHLCAYAPLRAARILIDAVASMIRMTIHPEDLERGRSEDYSEIWCRRLDRPVRDYQASKEALAHALTYACEQVYDKAPESIDALDQALRNQHWKVFKRLRQHLYASHPNDQTLPWIRQQILEHDEYSRWAHHYEFQLMIREASEHFGARLLTEEEQTRIFDAILCGPPKDEFRELMGQKYSDEAFQKRQRYFHHVQLRPFATLLSGEVRGYFNDLASHQFAEAVTDETYLPYAGVQGGTVSYRSPKSAEDLETLTEEELLIYLNDWDDEHWEKDNFLVEINIFALARAFQALFKERIVRDGGRLAFWMTNSARIERPIYVAAMVKAMQELVKEKDLVNLDQWIQFCSWVLSHGESEHVEGQAEPRDESREHPDWRSSRRAVVDFIEECVKTDSSAPIGARDGLADLLRQVCSQFDWRLDRGRPVILNFDDPISEAINNTRSRALESLIHFGFWIRRHLKEDKVPEVTEILSMRIADDIDVPLSRPEHALMGMHFGDICVLNLDWAVENREILFPQGNPVIWRDAFGSYIRFNRPTKPVFDILRSEFEHAVADLHVLLDVEDDSRELVDRLGQYLFAFYLWEIYPLRGKESLLQRFYDASNDDRKYWAKLFDHVGRLLSNSGSSLGSALIDRIIAFFNWRLEAAESMELQEFTFWLEAECLDPGWRLESFSKILSIGSQKDVGLSLQVRALGKLLCNHVALVVECFAKMTDAMDQDAQMYISADKAIPILRAGLSAEDHQVRENAERARENLLRLGRFDYLDVGSDAH